MMSMMRSVSCRGIVAVFDGKNEKVNGEGIVLIVENCLSSETGYH